MAPTAPADDHGLTVHDVPRAAYPQRHIPAGSEPCDTAQPGLVTDLPDLRRVPLADVAQNALNGDTGIDTALRRIAPNDGSRVLLVAASFNSAI
jgi:hypothetical protein